LIIEGEVGNLRKTRTQGEEVEREAIVIEREAVVAYDQN
jgi:hypothetical protein